MRGSGLISVVAVASMMLACATVERPRSSSKLSVTPVADTSEKAYEGPLKAPYLYTEGLKQSHINSDTAKAMEFFAAAIAADSSYAPTWYEAAATLAGSDAAQALKYSLEANRLDSTNMWFKSQLGRLYLLNENVENARNIYESLVKEYPKVPENYSMLAMIYQYSQQPYRAIMLLDSAELHLGRTPMLSAYKLDMLMGVKLYDRAIAESQSLIQESPYDYANYLTLGEIYADTHKDSLAMANFDIARALNPNGADVIISLNEYYKNRNDMPNFFATARELFINDGVSKGIKTGFYSALTSSTAFYRENYQRIRGLAGLLATKYPGDFDIMELYGRSMLDTGDVDGALNLYKSNINDTLPDIRVFNMILDLEAYRNRTDSVAKYAKIAQSYFPEDPEFYIRHGSALAFFMKDSKEAVASFEKALKYATNDSLRSAIYCQIGDTYQHDGNTGKSYENYAKAIKLWPQNVVALNNYSYFLSEQDKNLSKALEMSAKVQELEPGNPTYMDTYGWILFKLGRYEEAKDYLQQAISLDPRGSDEIFLHYGDVLHKLGDGYMAEIYWKKALDAGYDKDKIEERLKKAGDQ